MTQIKAFALLLLLAVPAQAEVVVPLQDDPTKGIAFTPSELEDKRSPAVRQQAIADRAFQLRIVPMRANGSCPRGSQIEPTYRTYCLQAK